VSQLLLQEYVDNVSTYYSLCDNDEPKKVKGEKVTKFLSIRVTEKMYNDLEQIAFKENTTISKLLRKIIEDFVREHSK
jgi:hypothetical protein